MNKTTVLLSILLSLCLLAVNGCGGGDPTSDVPDGAVPFAPEYDYVVGYDIASYFNGAKGTFEECNTAFWPYQDGESEIPNLDTNGYITSVEDMKRFAAKYADCELDANGNISWLNHQLYLAAVKRWPNEPWTAVTLNGGIEGHAICMVFVEYIRDYAPTTGYSTDQITEGSLLHELGHGRANLTHFCNGDVIDYNNHSGETCLMINNLPNWDCTDVSPLDGYHPYSFCDNCINNLKAVTW